MFRRYLQVVDTCAACGLALQYQRADDAPPYFTIFVVGHTIVPLVLVMEKLWQPALWIHFAIWLPLTMVLVALFLPRVKGATIGLQWALGMHGFGVDLNSNKGSHKT